MNLKTRWPSQLGTGVDVADRSLSIGSNIHLRKPQSRSLILACTSSNNNQNPKLTSKTQTYAFLKQQMDLAVKSQNFKEAARIRDSLREFKAQDPVLRIEKALKQAVHDQRFHDAAKCRDELSKIEPLGSYLKCSSEATTLGIRVQVRSVYLESRSQPLEGQYFFAYRIRITNNSSRPVQLLRRHWIITDAMSKTEHVWGSGVIGEQPAILPDTHFEYTSACPLRTSSGRMEGDFEMKHIDKADAKTFNVAIAPFSLSTLGDGTDSLG